LGYSPNRKANSHKPSDFQQLMTSFLSSAYALTSQSWSGGIKIKENLVALEAILIEGRIIGLRAGGTETGSRGSYTTILLRREYFKNVYDHLLKKKSFLFLFRLLQLQVQLSVIPGPAEGEYGSRNRKNHPEKNLVCTKDALTKRSTAHLGCLQSRVSSQYEDGDPMPWQAATVVTGNHAHPSREGKKKKEQTAGLGSFLWRAAKYLGLFLFPGCLSTRPPPIVTHFGRWTLEMLSYCFELDRREIFPNAKAQI
jgi:hypothetical protein